MAEQLTTEQVAQVAYLARLELTQDEQARLAGQLSDILKQFARLQELDTSDVSPTSHSLAMRNVFCEDETAPSLDREDATRNAPQRRDGNFIVPQIVDV